MDHKFKVGEIAFLNTTGEMVTVLKQPRSEGFNSDEYMVRRATQAGDRGVVHETDFFEEFELQTEQEKFDADFHRNMKNYEMGMKVEEATRPQAESGAKKKLLVN